MIGHLMQITPASLADILQGEETVEAYMEAEEIESLYLDKSWHAIHYILNGKAWEGEEPLVHVILGGTPIGEDYGYGPPRYLTPEQVEQVAQALTGLQGAELIGRYNPDLMAQQDIYPQIDWDDEEEQQYVFDYYWSLVDYYKAAAASGNGMLLYLT
ncbi:YfbM family protein [Paenibacillus phyllosphaerae]|nr:YfbM family protein [Paenibacillus phyllosphaerae]